MFNCLIMNMTENHIIDAYQGISDVTLTHIKHQYRHSMFKVMLVCPTIFSKYKQLHKCKHGNIPINHLVRISNAYRDAIKHISPRKRKG
ncbi:hypothetical protein TZ03_18690 [Pseudomonas sp. 10-1B]|nr:hypothetical protein TZ03_18690 [Pseudomonas sp. 10-1B]